MEGLFLSACHAEGRGFEPRRSRQFSREIREFWRAAKSVWLSAAILGGRFQHVS